MVVGIHADLVVAGESIHEAKEFKAGCGIYYEVDLRYRETIFRACSVDVSEINVESPFALLFFDKYNVGQPFKVFHFSDRTCLEELADLLINRLLSLWGETSSFLLNWFAGCTTFNL